MPPKRTAKVKEEEDVSSVCFLCKDSFGDVHKELGETSFIVNSASSDDGKRFVCYDCVVKKCLYEKCYFCKKNEVDGESLAVVHNKGGMDRLKMCVPCAEEKGLTLINPRVEANVKTVHAELEKLGVKCFREYGWSVSDAYKLDDENFCWSYGESMDQERASGEDNRLICARLTKPMRFKVRKMLDTFPFVAYSRKFDDKTWTDGICFQVCLDATVAKREQAETDARDDNIDKHKKKASASNSASASAPAPKRRK